MRGILKGFSSGWTKEYPKLRRQAKRSGAKIYFLDEEGFHSDPVLGRTYGLAEGRCALQSVVLEDGFADAPAHILLEARTWTGTADSVFWSACGIKVCLRAAQDAEASCNGKICCLLLRGHPL